METSETETQMQPARDTLKWGPTSAIVISFLAYFFAQLILFIPLAIIAAANHGQNVQAVLDNSAWLNLVLTGVSSAALLSVLAVFLKVRKGGFKDLGFRRPKPTDFGWIIIGLVVYYAILIATLSLLSLVPSFNTNQAQNIGYHVANSWQLIVAFVGLVILPPLAEETLFRGFLYRGLSTKWPKIIAALLASGLFAVVHFQWNVGVDVFILSMVMILLFEKTHNLWVCVGLHAIKNCIAFLMLFVFKG